MDGFRKAWRSALNDGLLRQHRRPLPRGEAVGHAATKKVVRGRPGKLEILFRADPTIWDGRFVNNALARRNWAKPFTKLAWDNAALISPALAHRAELQNGDVVELKFHGRTLARAGLDHAGAGGEFRDATFGLWTQQAGPCGNGRGFNAFALRGSRCALVGATGCEKRTGKTANRQHPQLSQRRRDVDIAAPARSPSFAAKPNAVRKSDRSRHRRRDDTLYNPDEFKYGGTQWGMSIDLQRLHRLQRLHHRLPGGE